MMWDDIGFLLSKSKYNENSIICEIFTKENGKVSYVTEEITNYRKRIKGVKEMIQKVIDLINFNEYKRRQVPLGIKISARNFGKDRRYPITNFWKNNI